MKTTIYGLKRKTKRLAEFCAMFDKLMAPLKKDLLAKLKHQSTKSWTEEEEGYVQGDQPETIRDETIRDKETTIHSQVATERRMGQIKAPKHISSKKQSRLAISNGVNPRDFVKDGTLNKK